MLADDILDFIDQNRPSSDDMAEMYAVLGEEWTQNQLFLLWRLGNERRFLMKKLREMDKRVVALESRRFKDYE